eukprot:gene9744-11968_t
MGATGKARVFLWTITIIFMLAGSLGMIIYNKPLGLQGLGNKTIAGTVWFNAVIALHSIYLIGTGFEIISRAYLMMVGSTCSEQRRNFLCCFIYTMCTWWKLMLIVGVISFIILGGLTALIILLEGFGKIQIMRLAITDAVSLVLIFFTSLSFVTSRKTQRAQDEEEEALYGTKKDDKGGNSSTNSTPSSLPPAIIQEKESSKEPSQNSAVLPA